MIQQLVFLKDQKLVRWNLEPRTFNVVRILDILYFWFILDTFAKLGI